MRNNKEKPVAFPLSCFDGRGEETEARGRFISGLTSQMIGALPLPCKGVYRVISDFISNKDTCKHNLFYRNKIVAIASPLRWWS